MAKSTITFKVKKTWLFYPLGFIYSVLGLELPLHRMIKYERIE